jgi:hypothetical protein
LPVSREVFEKEGEPVISLEQRIIDLLTANREKGYTVDDILIALFGSANGDRTEFFGIPNPDRNDPDTLLRLAEIECILHILVARGVVQERRIYTVGNLPYFAIA